MKTYTWVMAALLLGAISCGPQNEEVKDEQIDLGGRVEALDSIANVPKDALKTDENDITPVLPLPQPVIDALSDKYPGWEEPMLAPEVEAATGDEELGPLSVRGDFNGDNLQDMAMQIQYNKDVVVVAILQDTTRNWNTFELQRDVLFNERGKLQSLYAVHLVEQGEELPVQEAVEAPHDAVAITVNNTTTTYVFENGSFRKYTGRK